jgi:hypothetical protein
MMSYIEQLIEDYGEGFTYGLAKKSDEILEILLAKYTNRAPRTKEIEEVMVEKLNTQEIRFLAAKEMNNMIQGIGHQVLMDLVSNAARTGDMTKVKHILDDIGQHIKDTK